LVGTTVTSNGGAITLGGGADPLTTAAIGTDTTEAGRSGIYLSGSTLSSGAGAISLRGLGRDGTSAAAGIGLRNRLMTSGTGTIAFHGRGGEGASRNYGVSLSAGTWVESTDGAISLIGRGGDGTGERNYGVLIDTAEVVSLGSATLTLDGTAGGRADRKG